MQLKSRLTRSTLIIIMAVLILLEICSATVLLGYLMGFSETEHKNYISLTEGSEWSTVAINPLNIRPAYAAVTLSNHEDKTGFSTYDDNVVWSTDTDIEIFSVHYDEKGDATYRVNSENGEKVFAPGTGNTYSYTLKNSGSKTLDYTMTVEAYFKGTDNIIPIVARLNSDTGYLVGSNTEWPAVLKLNGASDRGKLSAGNIKDYTLEWQWPFERGTGSELEANDAYDTMLGNAAVNQDLELHIVIKTRATVGDGEGGKADIRTGDSTGLLTWIIAEVIGLFSIILLLVEKKKLRDKEKEMEAR